MLHTRTRIPFYRLMSIFVFNASEHILLACVAGGIVWVRLKFWRRSRVPNKGTALPPNLTRLYYNGSAAKSHSTILQRLRRQISLDYYTIPPATQANILLDGFVMKEVNEYCSSYTSKWSFI